VTSALRRSRTNRRSGAWNHRFSEELRDAVQRCADSIVTAARTCDVSLPERPSLVLSRYDPREGSAGSTHRWFSAGSRTIPRVRGQSKDEIVEELLQHATEMVDNLDLVMMDREFDSDPVKETSEVMALQRFGGLIAMATRRDRFALE
jgi:hypothetical protein